MFFELKKNIKHYSAVLVFFTTLVTLYSLTLQNIYTASSTLKISDEASPTSSSLSGLASLSPLASLASNSSFAKDIEAIHIIKSYDFYSEHFIPNIDYKNLVAADSWDPKSNKLSIREDAVGKISLQKGFRIYKSLLSINKDKASGFISLRIDHVSPHIAKNWIEIIVTELNESMRSKDQEDAKNTIEFLSTESNQTSINSLKETMALLLRDEVKKLMLASINEFYVFEYIESPIIEERKSGPNRLIYLFIGFTLGIFLSLLICFFRVLKSFNPIEMEAYK